MGADADPPDVRGQGGGTGEDGAPVQGLHPAALQRAHPGEVLAPGEQGALVGGGVGEELPPGGAAVHVPVLDDGDPLADAVDLVPVVGDQHRRAGELPQHPHELLLQLPAQEAVQGGEGLVQQQDLGPGDEDAGQGHPLLLPAGELGGPVGGQVSEIELLHDGPAQGPLLLPGDLLPDAGGDVLLHRHIGEEGIVLEQKAHVPLLRGQVDVPGRVEQHPAVEDDAPLVGGDHPGDAPEGHALAAAGGSQ